MVVIDGVMLTLDVHVEFGVRSVVRFYVKPDGPDDPFVAAVMEKWRQWSREQVAAIGPNPNASPMDLT